MSHFSSQLKNTTTTQIPGRAEFFAQIRAKLEETHRRCENSFQPATGYDLNADASLTEVLDFVSSAKREFDGSSFRAREILYLLLRYPQAGLLFELSEVRNMKSIAISNPPCRWEICHDLLSYHSSGNQNPFVTSPQVTALFEPTAHCDN